jgi:hypothetical protein
MRKYLFAALVSTALVVAMPATALARHHHRHHHSRIRHEHFGTAGGTSTTTSGDEMQGTAGTVDSFINGVLTIRLNDASLVSGMVTGATELQCEAPENEANDNDADDSGSGDRLAMDDGGSQSGDSNSGDDNGGDNDQGEDEQICTTAALTPGTVVQDAELNISSAGAVWHEVELVTP